MSDRKSYQQTYYQKNKVRLKERSNRRYAEKREEIRVTQNAYARSHRHEAQERQRTWREVHPEEYKEQARRGYATSAKRRAQIKLHTARRRAVSKCTCCTAEQFRAVYWAAELVGGEVDHVRALALGGIHCVKNLQILSVEAHKEKTKSDLAKCRRLHATAK